MTPEEKHRRWQERLTKWVKVGKEIHAEAKLSEQGGHQMALAALHAAGDVLGMLWGFEEKQSAADDKIHRLEVRIRELEGRHA